MWPKLMLAALLLIGEYVFEQMGIYLAENHIPLHFSDNNINWQEYLRFF
jgi:hypothetical protein